MSAKAQATESREPVPSWTLVTSHGLVLLYVAANQSATIHEIAERLDLTERRIADIIRDLKRSGLLKIDRRGRRNHYSVNKQAHFRHPILADVPFNSFVKLWQRAARNTQAQHE